MFYKKKYTDINNYLIDLIVLQIANEVCKLSIMTKEIGKLSMMIKRT